MNDTTTPVDVHLPQLGESVTEGTVTRWFHRPGDRVTAGEPLFEVSTDKVDTEVPVPTDGTLAEVLVAEGTTVAVGTVLAHITTGDPRDADPADEDTPAATTPDTQTAPAPGLVSSPEPAADPFVDRIPTADPFADQPRRATPSPAPVPAESPGPVPTADPFNQQPAAVPRPSAPPHLPDYQPTVAQGPGPYAPSAPAAGSGTPPHASPAARAALRAAGLDPAAVHGTGPSGRITVDDAKAAAAVAAPADDDTYVHPIERVRLVAGRRLTASAANVPHVLTVVEVDYANVDTARAAHKQTFKERHGHSLTYLPFIAAAVSEALARYPHLNAHLDGEQLQVHRRVHLGVAVDLDHRGLVVPVVRDAQDLTVAALSDQVHTLASRARARRLTADDMTGATFTISNNGSSGSDLTAPIIDAPQVAILSTDAVRRRPVAVRGSDGTETVEVHPTGNLSMCWDHRAVDGAYAAEFLTKVKGVLETRDWAGQLQQEG